MFSPTNEQLARLITVDKEIGPRRMNITADKEESLFNLDTSQKMQNHIDTTLEFINGLSTSRCK